VTDQLTEAFNPPAADALKRTDWPACREAEEGLIVTPPPATSQTVALATLYGSTTLLAITVTACGLEMTAGAVYDPLINVPIGGSRDQVTPVRLVPLTDAWNCTDSPAFRDAEGGARYIAKGLI